MFRSCLKINPNFLKANDAIIKLEGSEASEWYSWWFSHNIGKKILGILLVASILSPLLLVGFVFYDVYFVRHTIRGLTSFIGNNITILISGTLAGMGLAIGVLLLPSLTKIKVGSIVELETLPIQAENVKLETLASLPSLIFVSMPTEIPLESFRMPLQNLRMPMTYPVKSTRMPLQPFHHALLQFLHSDRPTTQKIKGSGKF